MEVSTLENRQITMSIRRLADEFEMARETISKRLAQHSILPCGTRNGHPVYRLKDAAQALIGSVGVDDQGNFDPRYLTPEKRNSWYQSELRRLDVEMQTGQLIPARQVEAEMAEMTRGFVQFLEILPDQLERDAGLSPDQVEAMHQELAQQRDAFYQRTLADAEADADPHAEADPPNE